MTATTTAPTVAPTVAPTAAPDVPAPRPRTPALVLGPVLRHVGATTATLWVEVDAPCVVRVRAGAASAREETWGVHGHHYAVVVVRGLPEGATTPYAVDLLPAGAGDGDAADAAAGAAGAAGQEGGRGPWPVWPPSAAQVPELAGRPASTIRTRADGDPLRLAFGSCRRSEPLDRAGVAEVGPDALAELSTRLQQGLAPRPDVLLMLGDQLYADEPSRAVLERLHASQRAAGERGAAADGRGEGDVRDEICTFEEYTWLYTESWSQPEVRWLLASVATCMLLDDHDLRDDWNTSAAWREEVGALPWFADRVRGALGSYWVYQHLGDLSPEELAADELLAAVRAAPDDAARSALLDDAALRADRDPASARWSFVRDLGEQGCRVRVVAVDCRCSRRLDPDDRAILDEAEWAWVQRQVLPADGPPVDHLLLAATLPALMVPALSDVEQWNEAVAGGAWGRWLVPLAERLRRAVDLEHWAAFGTSLTDLLALVGRVAAAPSPPASVLLLGGDVHCSYTARAELGGAGGTGGTAVHQLVMSPFRNPLKPALRLANRLAARRPVRALCRALARSAGVPALPARWEVEQGPWFENGVMTLVLEGRAARVEVDHVRARRDGRWQRRTTRHELVPAAPPGSAGRPAPPVPAA